MINDETNVIIKTAIVLTVICSQVFAARHIKHKMIIIFKDPHIWIPWKNKQPWININWWWNKNPWKNHKPWNPNS